MHRAKLVLICRNSCRPAELARGLARLASGRLSRISGADYRPAGKHSPSSKTRFVLSPSSRHTRAASRPPSAFGTAPEQRSCQRRSTASRCFVLISQALAIETKMRFAGCSTRPRTSVRKRTKSTHSVCQSTLRTQLTKGFLTITPSKSCPSFMSSERTSVQPKARAASMTAASQ